MIKLERGPCPKELTLDVKTELTRLYKENKQRDVWNSPKIKQPLKDSLLEMSHKKCAYCECVLNIESKDVTIDHFLPKSVYEDKVVEWENLLPACLRCNRSKNDNTKKIINPCEDPPQKYIAIHHNHPFRLTGIDSDGIGKQTIIALDLNNIDRVMVPRLQQCEKIHDLLQEILADLSEEGYREKYKRRFERLMNQCTSDNAYSAVKAANMLQDDCYLSIRDILIKNGEWTSELELLEGDLQKIALQFI